MNKAMLALLPLALVILVSGCTAPGFTPVGGAGVVIEAFEPDFSQIYSTENVQLQLKIKNSGSVDATGVYLDIFGIDISDQGWKIQDLESTCKTGKEEKTTLLAPDPARGTGGGSKSCIFTYSAPTNIPEGLSMSFNPTVRVGYIYDSQIVKSLTLLPSEEARRLQQQGGTFPAETVSASSGPISLGITTKGPIRVFTDNIEFPLEITINNVGGGVATTDTSDDNPNNWNKIGLTILAPSGFELTDCKKDQMVSLFKGQSNTITCNVRMTKAPTQPIQVQFRVEASYFYFIEKSTTIQVTGI